MIWAFCSSPPRSRRRPVSVVGVHQLQCADRYRVSTRPNAIVFEAANSRDAHEWKLFERLKLPKNQMLIRWQSSLDGLGETGQRGRRRADRLARILELELTCEDFA